MNSPQPRAKLAPHSRAFHRGAIGDSIDGRSALGRLVRHLEAELTAHVGGAPNITQKLLIERIIKLRLRLDAFEAKLAEGTGWTAHDDRTYGGCQNAYRLALRELGPPAASPADQTEQAELLRRVVERHRRAGAAA
jgi:hypothetical protein